MSKPFRKEDKEMIDFAIEGKNWQILLGDSQEIEEIDIPSEIEEYAIGAKFELGIILEPIGASKKAYSVLEKLIKFLSKEFNGIAYDRQLGQIITHKSYRKINLKPSKDKRLDLLTLNWWFSNSFFEQKNDYLRFIQLLSKNIKELIPIKYESFSSKKFRIEEEGQSHFIDWLWDNRNEFGRILYTKKPFYTLNIPSSKTEFYNQNGFCPKNLEIQMDSRILEIDGWEEQIRKTWRKINTLIKPIYSDVRILKNYLDKKSTVGLDNFTEAHPVYVGWKGIPDSLGLAFYIGNEYATELKIENNLQDSMDWRDNQELGSGIIPNSYQIKRKRIKKDFEDWAFNRFKVFYAEKYPFEKPENYEIDK